MSINNKIYPYERFIKFGIENLTDEELLALILRSGNKSLDVFNLSHILYEIIKAKGGGLSGLLKLTNEDIIKIPGIGKVKASQLIAIAEISKRIRQDCAKEALCFSNPSSISEYYMDRFRGINTEQAMVLFLDSRLRLISEAVISTGSAERVYLNPKDIFSKALGVKASGIILIHNHPSGNVNPSLQDYEITKYLKQYGEFLEIKLLDHLILGDNRYYSFSEHKI